ncbi:1-hydroxycarotenoid 3,4-desaturase [Rhodoblastus acidophilus]|uniref:1-hydroxycarotenoid 3,4-desaturase CrtD n=1 Tax=Rhodoblastus acidophilus TaxID=1074 RepID=UPI002224D3C3|nr:1-hydroxycarotenoid 3,4-desaturase CrtD [Rhodoblastus acidophilus]MCW2282314.1 1-hydroxycarotenoid 3,4-desaturase [Rhodoblastus acidophilus]MCW2331281.1 1-hydroxycarotenoid 3,4-desaturase [Rhodoblastus acidophilus]
MASRPRVAVVGAGVGGLVAAMVLAARGVETLVVEAGDAPGGKLRAVEVLGQSIDVGPTVFTLRDVFDGLFAECGGVLDEHLTLARAERLARHFWTDGSQLDLFPDVEANVAAIEAFAGAREAEGYRVFAARAAKIRNTLDAPFMRASRPSLWALNRRIGLRRWRDILAISPYRSLWGALGSHFRDPRLRQLFARYSTYCGSSPFAAPATLMLVSDVEREGVWFVEGGMIRLAQALAGFAETLGARFLYGASVERILVESGRACGVVTSDGERFDADAVLFNGDVSALPRLGPEAGRAANPIPEGRRSLSAVTFAGVGAIDASLIHHNVFFGDDYAGEFDAIFKRGRTPARPTVYVCASDRDSGAVGGSERLFCLVNAPPDGPRSLGAGEIEECEMAAMDIMRACGARLTWTERVVTSPAQFATRFPATGGSLYGVATHGWRASFLRPGARSRLPGLYLAGGGIHPGPGVPMAALSGRQAALATLADLAPKRLADPVSTRRSRPAAMSGGTSTPLATTENKD